MSQKFCIFGGSECDVVVARNEADARNLISNHHRIVTVDESGENCGRLAR
jgi:hypothetical protein